MDQPERALQPKPTQATREEIIAAAINEHGYLLQHKVGIQLEIKRNTGTIGLWKRRRSQLIASNTAFANPSGVAERNGDLWTEGPTRCILLPSIAGTGLTFGPTNPLPVQRQVLLV